MNFKKICASGAVLLPMLAGAAGGGCSGDSGIGTAVHLYTGIGFECPFYEIEVENVAWQAMDPHNMGTIAAWYGSSYGRSFYYGSAPASYAGLGMRGYLVMDQSYTMKRNIIGQNGSAIIGIEVGLPVRVGWLGSLFAGGEFNFSYGHARTQKSSGPHSVGILSVQPISYSFDVRCGFHFTRRSAIYGLLGTTNIGLHYKDKVHYTRQMFSGRGTVFFTGIGVRTSLDGVTFVSLEGRWAPKSKLVTAKPSKSIADAEAGFATWALKDSPSKIGWTSFLIKVTTRF
ncbi:MAG: hypothetical protein LBL30_00385 [Holosporales bacterium]|nr:hypothetical protein [Holosporales bacterium]